MVIYQCRNCRQVIGHYEGDWDDPFLGLSTLDSQWRKECIEVLGKQVVRVMVQCDACLPVLWDEGLWYN